MEDMRAILTPGCTRCAVDAQSRKRALEVASDLLAAEHQSLSARELFDQLMSRERLGSTALGEGVAIPHCRTSCSEITAAFLHLTQPVDYDAVDGAPVDLLFVLVVPEDETSAHLDMLAQLAALFGEDDNRSKLRDAPSDGALFDAMVGLANSQAA